MLKMTDLDLQDKRVLIRVDFNVPVADGKVTSDARIRAALPSIEKALAAGANLMLMSHRGRPKEGELTADDSMQPIADHLAGCIDRPVRLVADYLDGVSHDGNEVLMFENVRGNLGEKANDDALAKQLAALCDVFVNDAFGTAHRAHHR